MFMKILSCILFLLILSSSVKAQKTGILSGSVESNNVRYSKDEKTGALVPDDKFGSNNYLKLDYLWGNISAGLQYEGYFPSIIGYSNQLDGSKITNRYLSYTSSQLNVTVGHFYEQFGSGLIYRTYEERSLGINTAMDGVNASFTPVDFFKIKGVWGRQRTYMETGESNIRGGDVNLGIQELLHLSFKVDLGASWVNKHEDYTGPEEDFPKSVDSYAYRVQIEAGNFSLYSEYVDKGIDPSIANGFRREKGEAFLLNTGYSQKGLGINLTLRRIENMDLRSEREATGEVAMINYLPALTRQHKYALALLHPYGASVAGEIGGQLDIYYSIKKGSALGGKYGTKLHFNFAQFNNLKEGQWASPGDDVLFSDLSFDLTKKWTSKFRSVISYVNQSYNKGKIEGGSDEIIKSDIIIGDLQYKFNRKAALRGEVQHLWTKQDELNWVMGLLEFSYAPKWTVFASDMFNYGETDIHYFNVGGSYSYRSTRLALGYARNREGLQCVGGICRFVPAYTGFNLSLTTRF